jgi:hypothetical protein
MPKPKELTYLDKYIFSPECMGGKLFCVVMYSDFEHTRISYAGLFPNKQEILRRIPILNYNDLTFKKRKYKTPKSLFNCIEIEPHKKRFFNTYHLTDDRR